MLYKQSQEAAYLIKSQLVRIDHSSPAWSILQNPHRVVYEGAVLINLSTFDSKHAQREVDSDSASTGEDAAHLSGETPANLYIIECVAPSPVETALELGLKSLGRVVSQVPVQHVVLVTVDSECFLSYSEWTKKICKTNSKRSRHSLKQKVHSCMSRQRCDCVLVLGSLCCSVPKLVIVVPCTAVKLMSLWAFSRSRFVTIRTNGTMVDPGMLGRLLFISWATKPWKTCAPTFHRFCQSCFQLTNLRN